jgi:hypothetical protein
MEVARGWLRAIGGDRLSKGGMLVRLNVLVEAGGNAGQTLSRCWARVSLYAAVSDVPGFDITGIR